MKKKIKSKSPLDRIIDFQLELDDKFLRLAQRCEEALTNQDKRVSDLHLKIDKWCQEERARQDRNDENREQKYLDDVKFRNQHHEILEGYLKTFIKALSKKARR